MKSEKSEKKKKVSEKKREKKDIYEMSNEIMKWNKSIICKDYK